jgi:hypothetical protein
LSPGRKHFAERKNSKGRFCKLHPQIFEIAVIHHHFPGTPQAKACIMNATENAQDPHQHTANIKRMLRETVEHAREDVKKVSDPKAQALFETTAEVLQGLITAYDHYDRKTEAAWR